MTVSFKSADAFKAQLNVVATALKEGKTINDKFQVNGGFFHGLKVVILKIVTFGRYNPTTYMRVDLLAQIILKNTVQHMNHFDSQTVAKSHLILGFLNSKTKGYYKKDVQQASSGIQAHVNTIKQQFKNEPNIMNIPKVALKLNEDGVWVRQNSGKVEEEESVLEIVTDKIKGFANGIWNYFRQEQETN